MSIPFSKMHGLGNCYIYIDTVSYTSPLPQLEDLARFVSDTNRGIGADGLIVIGPSEQAAIQMRIFNKDGSEAKNCGNGLRCVAKYAYERHLVDKVNFTVETLGGIVDATVHVDDNDAVMEVTINMGYPMLERSKIPMSGGDGDKQVVGDASVHDEKSWPLTAVSMGNPHAIFFVDDINLSPLQNIGPLLADNHPLFPEGVNVGFVERKTDTEVVYRVWERGSGPTQACGTGACAAVVASCLNQMTEKGSSIIVHLAGGDLKITWLETNEVLMTGPAEWICDGRLTYR